jgi:hypothetical protein
VASVHTEQFHQRGGGDLHTASLRQLVRVVEQLQLRQHRLRIAQVAICGSAGSNANRRVKDSQ